MADDVAVEEIEEESIVDETGEIKAESDLSILEAMIQQHNFKGLNEVVLVARQNEVKWKFIQLRALYQIHVEDLWREDANYVTITDWLGELYESGVEYAAISTFYEKMKYIKSYLALHHNLNKAVLAAVKYDGLIRKAEIAGLIEVVSDGVGRDANYSDTHFTEKGKEFFGEDGFEKMTDTIARLPKGAANQFVNESFGLPSVHIKDLRPWVEKTLPFDIKGAPVLWGEVQLEDSQGNTPYQMLIFFEKGVVRNVIEGVGKRLKSNMRLLK